MTGGTPGSGGVWTTGAAGTPSAPPVASAGGGVADVSGCGSPSTKSCPHTSQNRPARVVPQLGQVSPPSGAAASAGGVAGTATWGAPIGVPHSSQ